MKALTAGFDATSNHLYLLFFSIFLDLLLWLGPRIRLDLLLKSTIQQFQSIPNLGTPELFQQLQITIKELNFLSTLRTYPVGIPSLMAARLTSDAPLGSLAGWELPTAPLAMALWLLFIFIGITFGTLFFTLVSQSALNGKITWKEAFNYLPRTSLQVCLLTVICLLILLAALLPFSCLLAVLMSGSGVGQMGYLIMLVLAGFLIWLLAPLVFSPHGIIVYQLNVLPSILRGFYLTRLTLPSTSLFILVLILLSEGLDVLWNIPNNSSWLVLLGIVGHAFVTTSLLAASFVYYRDADIWVRELIRGAKLSSA